MDNKEALQIRNLVDTDVDFVFNSWLRSFRNGTMCKNVANDIYFTNHHKVIEKLLARGKTLVACSSVDPKVICGYINFEIIDGHTVIHYIYVKQIYRKLGIGKRLLSETGHDFSSTPAICSHQTKAAIVKEEQFNLVYHPYILIKP